MEFKEWLIQESWFDGLAKIGNVINRFTGRKSPTAPASQPVQQPTQPVTQAPVKKPASPQVSLKPFLDYFKNVPTHLHAEMLLLISDMLFKAVGLPYVRIQQKRLEENAYQFSIEYLTPEIKQVIGQFARQMKDYSDKVNIDVKEMIFRLTKTLQQHLNITDRDFRYATMNRMYHQADQHYKKLSAVFDQYTKDTTQPGKILVPIKAITNNPKALSLTKVPSNVWLIMNHYAKEYTKRVLGNSGFAMTPGDHEDIQDGNLVFYIEKDWSKHGPSNNWVGPGD